MIFGIIFTPLIRITYIVYEWNYSDFYLQTSTSLFLYTNYIMVQGLFLSQNDIANLQISIYFIVLNMHLKILQCTVAINVFCIFKDLKAPSKYSFFMTTKAGTSLTTYLILLMILANTTIIIRLILIMHFCIVHLK